MFHGLMQELYLARRIKPPPFARARLPAWESSIGLLTGERIRDKISASKRKGMWMGGPVPLGYRVESRQLLVAPDEAQLVRGIFASFISSRSTTKMVKQLAEQGAKSKNGKTLSKQTIYKILHNRMYLGELGHKGEYFQG